MQVTIHNVGHGLCVSLIHDNGRVMLWDCGHSQEHRPSDFLIQQGITTIDRLIVTNYDEDHISDLPNIRGSKISISTLFRNKSIDVAQLRLLKLKSGPISSAMEHLLSMMAIYTIPVNDNPLLFPGVVCNHFYNHYGDEFSDTNNISLITFLECMGNCWVIPGDVETRGWKSLLKDPSFRNSLRKVNFFIASHHGRENGYCAEVFDYCKPNAFIFSDSAIKYATQEMASTYRSHASGAQFNNREIRYVLSTRKDGSLRWRW